MSTPEPKKTCRNCALRVAWMAYCAAEESRVDLDGTCAWWTFIPEQKTAPKIELWDDVPPEPEAA